MGFSDRYKSDKSATEDGTWVDFGDGIKVKLRHPASTHSKAVRRKLEEPFKALVRNGEEIPEADQERILTLQLANSLVLDWIGVTDDDGNAIPASPENIEKVLTEFEFFRADVVRAVADRSTFKKLVRDADVKNS